LARPLIIRRSFLAPFSAVALLGAASGRPVPTRDPRTLTEDPVRDEASSERAEISSLPATRVRLAVDRIVLREPIAFEFDRAVLRRTSHDLLLEVAMLLHDHPEIRHVRIEAHTNDDESGTPGLTLSTRRARTVRDHLVVVGGIEPERLSFVGHGPRHPIAPQATAYDRAKNRRVELVIVSRDEAPTSVLA
jgi:outer membrane protein OmpA-like peptidoglycan-associated protein